VIFGSGNYGLRGASSDPSGHTDNFSGMHLKGIGRGQDGGPRLGRVVLLIGAYAPVGLIIAARTIPARAGLVAAGVGVVGLASWAAFLLWLPDRQPRDPDITDIEPMDGEVTAYIVSLLLPLIAAGDPSTGDLIAYVLCGGMILFVAYVTNLAVVNPLIYFLGYRVAWATINGDRMIVLIKRALNEGADVRVIRAVGVTLIAEQPKERTSAWQEET